MTFAILEQLLDMNLLENVGEDESRYNFLSETSEEVANLLSDNIELLIPHVLVALDPECPNDEPILDDVEKRLKLRWKLLRQKYPDRPRQLLRAIILQAVELAAQEDKNIAAVSWLIGSSYLPFTRSNSTSHEFHNRILLGWLDLAFIADRYSFEDLDEDLELAESTEILPKKSGDSSKYGLKYLELKWSSLFSNTYTDKPIPAEFDPVPFEPNHFHMMADPSWQQEFAPRAAKFLSDYFEFFVNEHYTALANSTAKWLKAKEAASRGDSLRLRVIWWKQAMYSQSLRLGYRELPLNIATLAMVIDLHQMIPSIYPLSIDYVLQENLRILMNNSGESFILPVTLPQFIEAISGTDIASILMELPYFKIASIGRTSLLQYIVGKLALKQGDFSDFATSTGLDLNSEIKLSDLAVWLFRNLQALRLGMAESD